jgi:hypothetical protein
LTNPQFSIGIDLGTTHSVVSYLSLNEADGEQTHLRVLDIPQLTAPGVIGEKKQLPSFMYQAHEAELAPGDRVLPWDGQPETVVGELARQLGVRFVFAEKENDRLVIRRGFTFSPGERVLVAEDVVTRGGRAQECLDLLAAAGATPVAVAALVDRSSGQTRFQVPFLSLLSLSFPTYPADQLPPELASLPATKPGS